MANRQHTIEVNGTRYDAETGNRVHSQQPAKGVVAIPVKHHKSIDGVHRPKTAPSHSVHAKPAHSTTLMRGIVDKPHITATAAAIDQSVQDFSARRALEELRLHRAKKVPTSKLVSRFGFSEEPATITAQHVELEVQPPPIEIELPILDHDDTETPHAKTRKHLHAQLEHATSHAQKPLKKPKLHHRVAKKLHTSPRKLSAATAVVAFLLLGGFIAYQNANIIAIHVAANRAGVAAAIPGYTPSGFTLKTHTTKPGQITIGYRSNSDSRAFQITQANSSWDSSALIENFLGSNPYQTAYSKGRTIYLYDGNNATWVDNGVWFNIEGSANLSSDQLQHLVDSI